MTIEKIDPKTIIIPTNRQRSDFGNIDELAASIAKFGLLTSICVRRTPDGTYILEAGHRRLKAIALLSSKDDKWHNANGSVYRNFDTVPAIVVDRELNEYEIEAIELEENVRRKDLSWDERAQAEVRLVELWKKLYGTKTSTRPDAPGMSDAKAAKLLGVSTGYLSESRLLTKALTAIPELKNMNRSDALRMLREKQRRYKREKFAEQISQKAVSTPLDEKRRALVDSYKVGDAIELLKTLESESFDFAECDPPYGIGLPRLVRSPRPETFDSYVEWTEAQFRMNFIELAEQVHRILRPNSYAIFWYGTQDLTPYRDEPDFGKRHHSFYEFVIKTLLRRFTGVRHIPCIWYKTNFYGQSQRPEYCLGVVNETFVYCWKGRPMLQMQHPDVFAFDPVNPISSSSDPNKSKIHKAEKPIELCETIYRCFTPTGSRILIPFAGSGNGILAASNLGCTALGFDLSPVYRNAFIEKVYSAETYKSYAK